MKGERRIGFDQFCQAIRFLAEKKFPGDGQAFDKLAAQIAKAEPNSSGTQPEAKGIFSKLTDTSLYTGSHKERFDETGKFSVIYTCRLTPIRQRSWSGRS